jgi:aspartate ammonia-lyase
MDWRINVCRISLELYKKGFIEKAKGLKFMDVALERLLEPIIKYYWLDSVMILKEACATYKKNMIELYKDVKTEEFVEWYDEMEDIIYMEKFMQYDHKDAIMVAFTLSLEVTRNE